jgi:hypothetical protein
MLVMLRIPWPLLLSVTVFALLVVKMTCVGKVTLAGESVPGDPWSLLVMLIPGSVYLARHTLPRAMLG